MSERNCRLDNFYKCEYGRIKDEWEIKEEKGGSFSVVYMCTKPEVGDRCIEANKSNKRCPYIKHDSTCMCR